MNLLRNVWDRVRRQIVCEVPETDALCEFDCRRLQCTEGEWETCERRLRRAAGELMPARRMSPEPVVVSKAAQAPVSVPVDACE